MPIELRGGEDAKPKVLTKWGSLNTKSDRTAIPEEDFSWLENFFPIAPGNLRTLYAEGATLYTTANPRTIVAHYPYNIGSTAYVAVFLDDGSAVQVRVSDGATTTIGGAGTFYSGTTLPACSQYQSKYLIIGSDVSANAYWVWNGTALFSPGSVAPIVTVTAGGNNYTSAPTVTAYGGSGSGSTYTATINNNQVTDVVANTGGSGYLLGEQVVLGFSGGGSDASAVVTPYVAPCSGVSSVAVTTPGNFTGTTATVTIAAPTAGVQAVITFDVSGGGVVTAVHIGTPGSGYWKGPPTISFAPAGGTGATATISLDAFGAVSAVNITAGGSGYTPGSGFVATVGAPPVGTTATGVATVTVASGSNYVSAVTVTNPGWGYISPPVVTVVGSGAITTGPAAQASVTKGQITAMTVVAGGSGFTGSPAVVISAPDDPAAVVTQTATAVATLAAGVVTGIVVQTTGFGYKSAYAMLSGGNSAASATITMMPFGVQATAIETYNNQVWTTVNTKMSFTAPNSVSNFSTFAGGGSAPATDSFLRRALIGLRQNSGYLYRFADSSVNVVTNVTTSAAGITTYNNANVDAQIGTPWRDSICAFDRAVVFANTTGVYALFGGAVQKVSDALDGIFLNASFNTGLSGVTPAAAVCTMFGVRVYCLLLTSKDYLGANRTYLCCWNGQRWFVASQTKTVTLVSLQELDSVFTAWGSDGTRLFKLFQTASTSLTKTAQTRLDGADEPDLNWRVDNVYMVSNLTTGSSANLNIATDTDAGQATPITQTLAAGRNITFSNAVSAAGVGGAQYGTLRGNTITTTAADLQLIAFERLEMVYSRDQ